jgi:hypothetical protein
MGLVLFVAGAVAAGVLAFGVGRAVAAAAGAVRRR